MARVNSGARVAATTRTSARRPSRRSARFTSAYRMVQSAPRAALRSRRCAWHRACLAGRATEDLMKLPLLKLVLAGAAALAFATARPALADDDSTGDQNQSGTDHANPK